MPDMVPQITQTMVQGIQMTIADVEGGDRLIIPDTEITDTLSSTVDSIRIHTQILTARHETEIILADMRLRHIMSRAILR